ncbi:MAG: type II methionyl aminopeptidase [Nanoarchaeota archaeon]
MNSKDYEKAGQIASEARKYALTLVKPGLSYLELAEKVEAKIVSLGGRPAFPCNISVNDVAAHHIPSADETTVLKEGDLLKLDLGVHIDGAIADHAVSVSVGKTQAERSSAGPRGTSSALDQENEKLIEAANAAVAAAIAIAKPGVKVSAIGEAIEKEITSRGFTPIKNLCGHTIEPYVLHAGLSIPNHKINSNAVLKDGMVLAIEPFATTGAGFVNEGAESGVYKLEEPGAVRTGKEILDFIISEYKTLPFAKRWLVKKFNSLKVNLFLREALSKGILHSYSELIELKGSKVAQAEHTIIIKEKTEVLTK